MGRERGAGRRLQSSDEIEIQIENRNYLNSTLAEASLTFKRRYKMKAVEIDPKICNGKPVIAGTRIPVTVILDHLEDGCNLSDVQRKYPELSLTTIAAALRYSGQSKSRDDV
jgi:uncharacterized protein (DUF433 family)